MNKNNIKTTFFVLTSFLVLNEGYINARCLSLECINKSKSSINSKKLNERFFNTKQLKSLNISLNDNFLIKKRLGEEIHKLDKFINSILVATEKRPEVKIDWRVYTKNVEKPLIRDLIVEGLSLARTQKEEFSSVIQNNNDDINALFTTLEKFINK